MRLILCVALGVQAGLLPAPGLQQPVVIDRIVSTVNGNIIRLSDIRQARMLKLVNTPDGSDAAIQRALEDRYLELAEVVRFPPPEPLAADVAARRRQWEASVGTSDIPALLTRAGMSSATLDGWLRDDIRIERYLDRRFASTPDRKEAINAWLAGLRRRAGLKGLDLVPGSRRPPRQPGAAYQQPRRQPGVSRG
jgi:hypothetical protein